MLEKVNDKYNTVSSGVAFIESMYVEGHISLKEVNDSIRLVHEVVRQRVLKLTN